MTTTETTEAPRGFAVLVQQIEDGDLHAEISAAIQALNGKLDDYVRAYESTAKGEITIKLAFTAHPNGTVGVHGTVTSKAPPRKKRGSVFWLTKGNNLSPENPRQTKLPLREVPSAAPVRDLPADVQAPARSV